MVTSKSSQVSRRIAECSFEHRYAANVLVYPHGEW